MPTNLDIRLQQLNPAQREAVTTIFGPVMVIAGPGTGKTEVLSLRIAYLLQSEVQIKPADILCLTYTDEAAASMRRRLQQMIGAEAGKIAICTFHAFCNNLIQDHPERFSHRPLQPVTDLEQVDILRQMLENLPSGHPLRRLSGNIYWETKRLSRLFSMMKQENLRATTIVEAIDAEIRSLPEREEFIYKRSGTGFKAGDVKQAQLDDAVRKLEMTRAAAMLFPEYQQALRARGRYDFHDMILWVIEALRQDEALRQAYQERYQFVLVDEFQDTSGAQQEIMRLLTDYWEDPNLFVVGDDDQSIYEFQGARIRNILDFYQQYQHRTKVIVLTDNYRSSQPILDAAGALIRNNEERLIYQLSSLGLRKDLTAANERFVATDENRDPVICSYGNMPEEEAAVVLEIERLRDSGVRLGQIAILYAQHKQATGIMDLMDRRGIPYCTRKNVNVLQQPAVQQLIHLLRYLHAERLHTFSGEAMLFEIMHAPYWGVAATDIALLALQMQQMKSKDGSWTRWRLLLNNYLLLETAGLRAAKTLHRLGSLLEDVSQQAGSMPLPLLLQRLMHDTGMMAWLLHQPDAAWQMQVMHGFFQFARQAEDREGPLRIDTFLGMIDRMTDEQISLPLQRVLQQEEGVYCYTAHGAKGNEFEYVFLIGCTRSYWEDRKGINNDYQMPESISRVQQEASGAGQAESIRRLFYVALTRAKKYLYVSYARRDYEDKPQEPSQFISEMNVPEDEGRLLVVNQEQLQAILALQMQPIPEVHIRLADQKYIAHCVQQLAMSYTSLSKYLRCPVAFYYEHILKVPFLANEAMTFGTVVHAALERYFKEMLARGKAFPTLEELIQYFDSALYRHREAFTKIQYERRQEQGRQLLKEYIAQYAGCLEQDVIPEYKVPRYMLEGIPVTGKLDKLIITGHGVIVVDYKTGDPDSKHLKTNVARPDEQQPLGGDYWRQMVFYKILLERQPGVARRVISGYFDYVEKGRNSGMYKRVSVDLHPADEEVVMMQLHDVWHRIQNQEFERGCGREDCKWCQLMAGRAYKK